MSDRFTVDDLGAELLPEGDTTVSDMPPYHILLVSDFAGSNHVTLKGPINDQVLPVTPESFDSCMATACPTLAIKIIDPVKGGSAWTDLFLTFDSIRAFEPDSLIRAIPNTKSLSEVRKRLVARLQGQMSGDALHDFIQGAVASDVSVGWLTDFMKKQPITALPDTQGEMLDKLLDQLDIGENAPHSTSAKSAIGSIVSAAAGASPIPPEELSALRHTLAELDRRTSAWLTSVLHTSAVQSLESTWRSLAFLVKQMNFRKGMVLSILHAPRTDLQEVLKRRLIDPVFDAGAESPDLILLNYQFGNTASDTEALDEAAQHAASLPAVAIAGIGPAFFGVKFAWQVPTLPPLLTHFDQYQFAKWRTLRSQVYSRSLAVVFGRCLLRSPHTSHESTEYAYSYRETVASDADLLWANGVIAAASATARSVAELGWPTAMTGQSFGAIDGFATAMIGPNSEKSAGPTDTHMPLTKVQELARIGANAVVAFKPDQEATFWNGLSAALPASIDAHAMLEVSLPYHLFASRLGRLLLSLKSELYDLPSESVEVFIKDRITNWLSNAGPEVSELITVHTRSPEDDSAGLEFVASIVPPPMLLPGGLPMVLGYRIR